MLNNSTMKNHLLFTHVMEDRSLAFLLLYSTSQTVTLYRNARCNLSLVFLCSVCINCSLNEFISGTFDPATYFSYKSHAAMTKHEMM